MVLTRAAMSQLSREELENHVVVQDAQFDILLHGIQKELYEIQEEMTKQKHQYDKLINENERIKKENNELKKKSNNK